MSSPERKRQRVDDYDLTTTHSVASEIRSRRLAFLASLDRAVSPPGGRQSSPPETAELQTASDAKSRKDTSNIPSMSSMANQTQSKTPKTSRRHVIQSPFKLTRIRDMAVNANVDTISIGDILGDVMLKEVWLFDFLYDVDWVM
jgi:tyrosyl-DNA phosphodiesterase 1